MNRETREKLEKMRNEIDQILQETAPVPESKAGRYVYLSSLNVGDYIELKRNGGDSFFEVIRVTENHCDAQCLKTSRDTFWNYGEMAIFDNDSFRCRGSWEIRYS